MFTDGVSVSLLMRREKNNNRPKSDKQIEQEKQQHIEDVRRKLLAGYYDLIVGIDSENRIMVAANALWVKSGFEFITKYMTGTFRWDVGQFHFKNKRHALTKDAVEAKEADRLVFPLFDERTREMAKLRTLENPDIMARNAKRSAQLAKRLERKQAAAKNVQNDRKKKIDYNDPHRIELSPKSWNYRNYVECELEHLQRVQKAMSNERFQFQAIHF